MIFRDVQLLNSGEHGEKRLAQNRFLMSYWENVRDIFCMNLADNLNIAGIAKLNIRLGPFNGPEYEAPLSDGIATYRRSDFDFDEFRALSDDDKQGKSLFYIEDSIIRVCEKLKASKATVGSIRSAADAVRKCNYEHRRIYRRTTKWNARRNFIAVTELHHKKGGIDADLLIYDKQGCVVQKKKVLEDRFWEAVWFDLWKGYWKAETFIIENRVGNVVYTTEVSVQKIT